MKERPILFSTPMVQAILDGRKTQTRRVIKYPKNYDLNLSIGWEVKPHKDSPELFSLWWDTHYTLPAFRCPHGQSGDVLWVRETWNITDPNDCIPGEYLGPRTSYTGSGPNGDILWRYVYKATSPESHPDPKKGKCRWKSPLFMPREACRIRLEITDIRVERLQDISEEDAIAEGIVMNNTPHGGWFWMENVYCTDSAQYAYERLWESINGHGSWEKNPWVWVVEFKRIDAGKS